MGDWRGILAFATVIVLMVMAASWLIRETPNLLSSGPAPSNGQDTAAVSETPRAAAPDASELPPAPPTEQATLDAAAIEAAVELTGVQAAVVSVPPEQACEVLGGTWREDSGGWCEALLADLPVSDTAELRSDMVVPCPQPLEKILEQVVAKEIDEHELRIYLLFRSVDDDLEALEVDEESGADVRPIADSLREVESFMRARAAAQRADLAVEAFLPMEQRPVPGGVGSGFGPRVHPVTGFWSQHNGVDIKGDTGDPVLAVLDGEVLSAQYCPFYGNTVVMYHGAGLSTVYAHLDSFAVAVAEEVESGRLVGAMGTTGRSTGPHLHFEARVDGRAVDPEPFMPMATP